MSRAMTNSLLHPSELARRALSVSSAYRNPGNVSTPVHAVVTVGGGGDGDGGGGGVVDTGAVPLLPLPPQATQNRVKLDTTRILMIELILTLPHISPLNTSLMKR